MFPGKIGLDSTGIRFAEKDRMPVSGVLDQDGLFHFFLHPAIKHVGDVVHVREQTDLRAVNGRQSQVRLKRRQFSVVRPSRSNHPTQTLFGHLEGGLASEDAAQRR